MANEIWIETELIPILIEQQSITLKSENNNNKLNDTQTMDISLKYCDIKLLSVDEAFMLTKCYKVTIAITDSNGENETIYRIVVKVRHIYNEAPAMLFQIISTKLNSLSV